MLKRGYSLHFSFNPHPFSGYLARDCQPLSVIVFPSRLFCIFHDADGWRCVLPEYTGYFPLCR